MTQPTSSQPPAVPHGTHPRRPAWPLLALIALFVVWFAFLIVLALKYPAR